MGLHTQMLPFIKGEAKDFYETLLDTNKKHFPHYFEELRGVADGCNMNFEEILALNLYEIGILLKRSIMLKNGKEVVIVKGCTDVMFKDSENILLAHNEDMPFRDFGWLIHAEINTPPLEKFTSYTYPGMLPGNAFSWNAHGILIGINYMNPMELNGKGLSVPFVCRSLLSATSISDLISKMPSNCASGVNLNVISMNENRLVNIEIIGNIYSVREINGAFSHYNTYKTINVEYEYSESSSRRGKRVAQLPATNVEEMKVILGDTFDKQYPIYRNCAEPDEYHTAATVIFDVRKKTASIFVKNPTESDPFLVFPL